MYDVTPITSDKHMACGPVCLRMLLKYYGQDVPMDQLIEECHAGIAGCSGKDINVAGRLHGLDMRAFQMDAAELLRQDRPAIIHWRKNHFVVFCGIDDAGEPVICNPSRGRFALDADSFSVFYSGVAFFNGEPADLPEPVPVPDITELSGKVDMLTDCILEMSEVVYDG